MEPPLERVMAAPNRSRLRGRLLKVERSPNFADKWLLEFEILGSESISGPNFAREGQIVKGFAILPEWTYPTVGVLDAQVEYIGGSEGGQYHLLDFAVKEL
jgi:hypothetical protein